MPIMSRIRLPKPTDAEFAILAALWRNGPSTVKQVNDLLDDKTGYTTTLKLLQIMTEKGLVVRDPSERAHVYQAAQSETETQGQLLNGLLHKAFGGSTSQLVMQALSSKRATSKELAEIKKLIDQLAKEGK
jgi:predicted transcriptional regulator